MASTLQLRGADTATVNAITPASREVLVDTTTNRLRVGDGSTAGGNVIALLADVSAHPGITNLSGSGTASVYTIASDTGTNATIPAATNAAAGVATAAQITELEALRTSVGGSATDTDLGTSFTGSTIQNNRTVTEALQDLETEVEDRLPDFVQWQRKDGGYRFTASNQYHTLPHIDLGTGDFSFIFALTHNDAPIGTEYLLLKPSASGNNRIVLRIATATTWEIAFVDNGGSTTAYTVTIPSMSGTAVYGLTFDRDGNFSIYVNGELVDSVSISGSSSVNLGLNTSVYYLSFSSGAFDGAIHSVRLFNRALSASDVAKYSRGEATDFSDRVTVGTDLQTGSWFNSTSASLQFSNFSGSATGFTADYNNANSSNRAVIALTKTLVPGKRYRASFTLDTDGASVRVYTMSTDAGGGAMDIQAVSAASATATSVEFVQGATTGAFWGFLVNSVPSSGSIAVSNFTLKEIGEVASYLSESAEPTRWLDVTGLNRHSTNVGATHLRPSLQETYESQSTAVSSRVGTGPGYYVDTSSGYITASTLSYATLTNSDFTVVAEFTPEVVGTDFRIINRASTDGVYVEFQTSGIQWALGATSSVYSNSINVSHFSAGKRYVAVASFDRDGNLTIWINSKKVADIDISAATGAISGDIRVGGLSTADKIVYHSTRLLNRKVTDAEAVLVSRGQRLGFADRGATGAASYTSDFSAGVDGWTASNGAVAGNIDAIGGEDDTLRFTIDNTNSSHVITKASVFTTGKRYRIAGMYRIPSTNDELDGVRFTWIGSTVVSEMTFNSVTPDTWVSFSYEGVVAGTSLIAVGRTAAGSDIVSDAGGDDVLYLKGITITPIGEVLSLLPSGAAPTVWADQSGNGYNGTVTGATLINPMPLHADAFVSLTNLPTSSAGLATGRVWNDSGTLKVV